MLAAVASGSACIKQRRGWEATSAHTHTHRSCGGGGRIIIITMQHAACSMHGVGSSGPHFDDTGSVACWKMPGITRCKLRFHAGARLLYLLSSASTLPPGLSDPPSAMPTLCCLPLSWEASCTQATTAQRHTAGARTHSCYAMLLCGAP